MIEIVRDVVLGFIVLGGVWLYGYLLQSRFVATGVPKAKHIANRFRYFATLLITAAFVIGTLYRVHGINFYVAIMIYIPIGVGFLLLLRWLQPYLQFHKEDFKDE